MTLSIIDSAIIGAADPRDGTGVARGVGVLLVVFEALENIIEQTDVEFNSINHIFTYQTAKTAML